MNADESGHSEQRLSSHSRSEARRLETVLQRLMPSLNVEIDVTVESACGPYISTEIRQRTSRVDARKVRAVVTKEDTIPIGLVAFPVVVAGCRNSNLNTSAQAIELC
ncbi:MAG: hypothetical protein ABI706_07170 [Ilumatobacteraceae bacterium]